MKKDQNLLKNQGIKNYLIIWNQLYNKQMIKYIFLIIEFFS